MLPSTSELQLARLRSIVYAAGDTQEDSDDESQKDQPSTNIVTGDDAFDKLKIQIPLAKQTLTRIESKIEQEVKELRIQRKKRDSGVAVGEGWWTKASTIAHQILDAEESKVKEEKEKEKIGSTQALASSTTASATTASVTEAIEGREQAGGDEKKVRRRLLKLKAPKSSKRVAKKKSPTKVREIAKNLSLGLSVSRYQPWCSWHKRSEAWPCTCNGMGVSIKGDPFEQLGEGYMVSELYEITGGYAVLDVYYPGDEKKGKLPLLLERVPWHQIQLHERLKLRETVTHLRKHVNPKTTASSLLCTMFEAYGPRPCFGTKINEIGLNKNMYTEVQKRVLETRYASNWIWTTYEHSYRRILACRAELKAEDILPGAFVGTCGENSKAYLEAQMCILTGGYVCVPISVTQSDENTIHIIMEANIQAIFVSPKMKKRVEGLVETIRSRHNHMIKLLSMDEKSITKWTEKWEAKGEIDRLIEERKKDEFVRKEKEAEKTNEADGKRVIEEENVKEAKSKATIEKNGKKMFIPMKKTEIPGLEDPRIVLYTSGSTGRPKGAVMSDAILREELKRFLYDVEWNGTDVGIYDSPAAVSSSLYNMVAYLMNGGRVSVFENLSETFDVCESTGPSSLGMVPQKWNILFKRYQARLQAGEKKEELDKAFKSILGWRVTYLNCGGATPIPAVQKWLKDTFPHCKITENYAATECGGITNSREGDIGRIKEGVQVKLIDWGEYKSTDKPYPRGEICVKTKLRASGYLNRPDLTAQAWDKDGFYRTGDIGELIDQNHLRIIDRKKNVFKLLNGEWVSPENIENVYLEIEQIQQIFIHGTSRHSKVVALIVPSPACYKDGKEKDDMKVHIEIAKLMTVAANTAKLRHFEFPQAFQLIKDKFTEEKGTLTQSGKLCRPKIRKDYKACIQELLDMIEKADNKAADDQKKRIGDTLSRAVKGSLTSTDLKEWENVEWDSISTMLTQGLIEAEFGVKLTFSQLLGTKNDLKKLGEMIRSSQKGELKVQSINWAEEAKLPSDFGTKPSDTTRLDTSGKGPILLTGVTGFLGAAMLTYLINNYIDTKDTKKNSRVFCLARENKRATASKRVRKAMLRRGQDMETYDQLVKEGFIVVVAGDLGKPKLGLSAWDYGILASTVTQILHAGSLVNHMWDYHQLRKPNVDGTTEVLRLAMDKSGPLARVHYISTISVINKQNGNEQTVEEVMGVDRLGGYAQSKWVAEARIREACEKKLVQCTIHRPGLLGPDSDTGAANVRDWLIRFISGCVLMGGVYYSNDRKGLVHLAAVNHAAEAMISLSLKLSDFKGPVYHTPVTKITNANELIHNIASSPSLLGRRVRSLSSLEWSTNLDELPPTNPLYPFRTSFKGGLSQISGHNHEITSKALADLNLPVFKPSKYSQSEIDKIVRFIMSANKLIADRPMLRRTISSIDKYDELKDKTAAKLPLPSLARWRSVSPS
mmetsp:Transcript_10028/g.15030  ORF Transcript_10028/g.15030 Transcript_10028/m.15030 type:complete len:1457 (-) Transcript_10028:132-4502(-)